MVTIDWNAIVNNNAMPADYTCPPGRLSRRCLVHGRYEPLAGDPHPRNDFSLPNAGRGIIIADSDFTISGSNMWNGIISSAVS